MRPIGWMQMARPETGALPLPDDLKSCSTFKAKAGELVSEILIHSHPTATPMIVIIDDQSSAHYEVRRDSLETRHHRVEPVAVDVGDCHSRIQQQGLLEESFYELDVVLDKPIPMRCK